ncbi:alpha-L-arabinofuranosidase C-terminal domain-containing protein [Candidatus Latescibacterota bacterium]
MMKSAISVDLNAPGKKTSPLLYGLFIEEIGHAGDGGIYAEQVRNRSFDEGITPEAWKPVEPKGSTVRFFFDTASPLNATNTRALRMDIVSTDGGRAGIANEGYWGMAVKQGETYDFSLFVRCRDFKGPLRVTLEDRKGTVYGQASITGIGGEWRRFTATLTANATDSAARLVISSDATGTVWIDTVSLFPRATWNNRPRGFRSDLVQKLKDLSPSFIRFPGGTYVQGNDRASAFRWKTTIGPIEERPGHYNAHWVYWSSDGLGFHEYLQLADDLDAIPMYVAYAGMSWTPTSTSRFGVMDPGRIEAGDIPLEDMGPIVQDVLDAIEYANGPTTSTWGALRAKNGHTEPFGLRYIEIGNEDGRNELYYERYMMIYNAVKEKYSDIEIIANGTRSGHHDGMPIEMVDEHAYIQPLAARSIAERYDTYSRDDAKVFLGEFAVQQSAGPGNFRAALTEGILLNGLERNSDVILMTAYAPLFSNVNSVNWRPNLIYFDSDESFGTPSYYLQKMYSANRLTSIAPVSVESDDVPLRVDGGIGISMDNTQAEFKDIRVISGEQVLYDFTGGEVEGWEPFRGEWGVEGAVGMQTGNGFDLRCSNESFDTGTTYTYTMKARKTGGDEGFRILFGVRDGGRTSLSLTLGMRRRGMLNAWNGGGSMDVPMHCIEHSYGGVIGRTRAGSIDTGRWYDIRIEVEGRNVRCFLDDVRILTADLPEDLGPSLYAIGGRAEDEDVILKVVNAAPFDSETAISLPDATRLAGSGTSWTLSSDSFEDQNTFESPEFVSPLETDLTGLTLPLSHTFPAQSVTVLRLEVK